jgi:uncharacterized protein (TIGR03066 family)
MKTLGVVATVFFFLQLPALGRDKDNAAKIVGTWEATKEEGGMKITMTAEFTKDGKVKLSVLSISLAGTYKVEGNSLKITLKQGEKEKTETNKIKELTDTKLVLEDEKAKETIEFKKK